MSTYYEYQDVKVMISHKLMNMEGWKVYGYHADESDSMTDYYSPAYWDGVAEKNGYILCVGVYGASKGEDIKQYNKNCNSINKDISEKISKLESMTVNRGASEEEERTAKEKIKLLLDKAEVNVNNYTIVGRKPAHMAHPPKANWHIEKDGVIVAKGNGILKFAHIDQYYKYSQYIEDIEDFKTLTKDEYIIKYTKKITDRYYFGNEEDAKKDALSHYETLQEDKKLIDQFEALISKFDSTCGCLVGEGTIQQYETIKVIEYKKENKAVEIEKGSIKEGQCFILKTSFNYGRNKGLVYRIHESDYNGVKSYRAYKLNGKLTKECTGRSDQTNSWYIQEDFTKWIDKGSIAWCEIQEVKTPYEVEKVIKKAVKSETKQTETAKQEETEQQEINNLTYEIIEDTDTRDNTQIFIVKVKERLSREDYITVNNQMKSIGGYYSKFKKGFLFKENPTKLLNNEIIDQTEETVNNGNKQTQQTQEEPQKEVVKPIEFEIIEEKHIKTNSNVWLVKTKSNLSKDDFLEVKRKLAILKGFYSSMKEGFIFNYNPTEVLII